MWLGSRLDASGFSFSPKRFSETRGHSPLMGMKEEAWALCPRLCLCALALGNLPGALGGGSIPAYRWGALGPARLGNRPRADSSSCLSSWGHH